MPKDAKFGLVFGIGLVLLIALLFFRKEPLPSAIQQADTKPTVRVAQPTRTAPVQKRAEPREPEPIVPAETEPLEEIPPLPPPPVREDGKDQ